MKRLMFDAVAMALAAPLMQQAEGTATASGGNGQGAARSGGTAASKPQFCKKSWDENGVCYFKFGNGTELQFDTNKCNDETKLDLRCHGALQKIGDSFAGVKGNYGEGITNAQGVIDQLYAGDWNADREGGAPRLQELAEAIARIKGVSVERARAAVEKASDEDRRQWRSNPGVKATLAKLRLEKAEAQLAAAGEQPQELNVSLPEEQPQESQPQ